MNRASGKIRRHDVVQSPRAAPTSTTTRGLKPRAFIRRRCVIARGDARSGDRRRIRRSSSRQRLGRTTFAVSLIPRTEGRTYAPAPEPASPLLFNWCRGWHARTSRRVPQIGSAIRLACCGAPVSVRHSARILDPESIPQARSSAAAEGSRRGPLQVTPRRVRHGGRDEILRSPNGNSSRWLPTVGPRHLRHARSWLSGVRSITKDVLPEPLS